MHTKHLISLGDLTPDDMYEILDLARRLKAEVRVGLQRPLLAGKTLAMIFQKPSLRTRVSFEVAMLQTGGNALYLAPDEVQLGRRESVPDVARVLSRYVDGITARTFSHGEVELLAQYASVPVINALSDLSHPCQGLGDYLTIYERLGHIRGVSVAYVGDGNNVAHSLLLGGALLGVDLRIATPSGYGCNARIIARAIALAKYSGARLTFTSSPEEAVRAADVVYTDVWASMGQESEARERLPAFARYQVNHQLLGLASSKAVVMHCLPAHRGEEITDDVIDGTQSIVFDQAENRLHAQKALLVLLMGKT